MPRSTTRYGRGGLMFTTRVKEVTGKKKMSCVDSSIMSIFVCGEHTQIEWLATATSYDLTAVTKIDYKIIGPRLAMFLLRG